MATLGLWALTQLPYLASELSAIAAPSTAFLPKIMQGLVPGRLAPGLTAHSAVTGRGPSYHLTPWLPSFLDHELLPRTLIPVLE